MMPIHFFTIVLNGMPFIRYHVKMFKDLPYDWHWHIVEGVADLKYDTQWSLINGGRIVDSLHLDGLSNDGTTEYLDVLKDSYSERISIYRKEKGKFWEGKVEMCNSFISNLPDKCILWQIDVDEFWGINQISKMIDLFERNPEKWGAFVYCYYFVGPRKYVTSMDTWSTRPEDWLRIFRFNKGFSWQRHEPPTLVDKNGMDWPRIRSFKRDETLEAGITFQHFAYSIPAQVYFKEIYYGYTNALDRWKNLQDFKGKIRVHKFLPWATSGVEADDWDEEKQGKLLFFGDWRI
jgi:hypothetical protein